VRNGERLWNGDRLCGIERDCVEWREIMWNGERLCGIERDCVEWREIVWNGERLCGMERDCIESQGLQRTVVFGKKKTKKTKKKCMFRSEKVYKRTATAGATIPYETMRYWDRYDRGVTELKMYNCVSTFIFLMRYL